MLIRAIPKLPMRDKEVTKQFYLEQLGFQSSKENFDDYLMLYKDEIEIHFFEYLDLDPFLNDGQVYIRTCNIDQFYQDLLCSSVPIHPNGKLEAKMWGQKEFSILDPDHNLLTFGEAM